MELGLLSTAAAFGNVGRKKVYRLFLARSPADIPTCSKGQRDRLE
jgi:hypothetical protein